jgi:Glycosyl transferase family group 2
VEASLLHAEPAVLCCAGTNFCVRANSLATCGWFPNDSITEDYLLGMLMRRHNMRAVYLNEFIAIGEAPEEVRNIFRQRSRWCKGQMQVRLGLSGARARCEDCSGHSSQVQDSDAGEDWSCQQQGAWVKRRVRCMGQDEGEDCCNNSKDGGALAGLVFRALHCMVQGPESGGKEQA